jgi:hypothetical protein
MANRVLLGKRGSDYGLWVSKPGVNVLTCDPEDMIFDTDLDYGQVVAKGSVSSATNVSVTVRDGVDPYVVAKGYSGTTISTRQLATAVNTYNFFVANASDCVITYSGSGNSGTVTLTPNGELGNSVNYIVFQGTT